MKSQANRNVFKKNRGFQPESCRVLFALNHEEILKPGSDLNAVHVSNMKHATQMSCIHVSYEQCRSHIGTGIAGQN